MHDVARDSILSMLTSVNEVEWREAKESQAILEAMAQIFSGATRFSGPLADRAARLHHPLFVDAPATVALVAIDAGGRMCSWNPGAQALLGHDAEDVVGDPASSIFETMDDGASQLHERLRAVVASGSPIQLRARKRDGASLAVAASASEVTIGGAHLTTLAFWDVSRHGSADAERREAEARYRSLIEQIPAVTFMGALSGDVIELYVSPQIEALLGFSQREWLSDPFLWFRQLHPGDRDLCNREFARGCGTGGPFRAEFRALTRSGEIVWIRGEARMVRDADGRPLFIQGIAYDITESKRAEEAVRAHAEEMKASLAEKEVLLREIHHRVKNNLQVISSLLKLQSGHVHDKAALDMFNESRTRIQSMALVHEKLYQSGNFSQIDFAAYVESLTSLLLHSYASRGNSVTIEKQIREVTLGIDVAVPLGMIINELVSNSLKYAFPQDSAGTIRLDLGRGDDGGYRLTIADDGIGLPASFDFATTATLGMQLVRMLTQQIGGEIDISRNGGTAFRISFDT